jgi:hypothetical protein
VIFDEHSTAISANTNVSRAMAVGMSMGGTLGTAGGGADGGADGECLIELLQTPLGLDPATGKRLKLRLLSYGHPLLGAALMDDEKANEQQQQPVMWGSEHEGSAARR